MTPTRPEDLRSGLSDEIDQELAADRTHLSNERTLLAYVRTGMALFGVGATFIRFFERVIFSAVGWVLLLAGIAVVGFGIVRFKQIRGRIGRLLNHSSGD